MADDYEIRIDGEGPPKVELSHGLYGLGCLPKHVSANAGRYPPVGSAYPDIPSAQWTEQDLRPFCVPVLDQGQTEACGPHAVVEALGCAFAVAGEERPLLSPWFVYGVLNHGRDNGTALPDLLKVAEETGVPLDASVKRGDFSGRYPATVTQEAKRFRIEAAYDSPTLANLCSAAERRQVSVIGIDIGQDFNPGPDGVLPLYRQGPQILGHAISVVGKKLIGGQWYLMIQNHWTSSWGLGGFAYLHPSYINPYFGGWTLRVPALDPLDPNRPPVT